MRVAKLMLISMILLSIFGCGQERKEDAPKNPDEAYKRLMDQNGAKDYLEKMEKEK